MDDLLRKGLDAHCNFVEGLAHAFAGCSSDHIVAIESGIEGYRSIEIFVKLIAELLQVAKRNVYQFDTFVDSVADRIPDLFMCRAKGNSLVHEIRRGSHCVQITGVGCCAHAIEVEAQRSREARDE